LLNGEFIAPVEDDHPVYRLLAAAATAHEAFRCKHCIATLIISMSRNADDVWPPG
jgi:hypothetical protein